jgi:uncharacterized membrane protein HdeD (DUF308 family)
MSKWMHPQGLVALLAGIFAALSPMWNQTASVEAMNAMFALGVVTAVVALLSLALPGRVAFEGLIAFMGLLFVLSPWVMGFTGDTSLARTAWIVGIVALVAGAADVQMTRTEHRGHGTVTHS